jgi:hypothetical protein
VISDDILSLPLVDAASLGLSPELLRALTSTPEQRLARSKDRTTTIKQLSADSAVTRTEIHEARRELLAPRAA